MKIEQRQWVSPHCWNGQSPVLAHADLVLIFGETSLLKGGNALADIRTAYPKAVIFGCSTSGEIQDTHVYDDTVSVTAVDFDRTQVKPFSLRMPSVKDSFEAGLKLAQGLDHVNLTHALVLSVGLQVNGSDLVKGLRQGLPASVTMTGGLAGDQDRFQETLVIAGGEPANDMVAVLGFYGSHLRVSSASLGGWDAFGPERKITKSSANVLYELDEKSALNLYELYLGEQAKDLPGSALLFPLCLRIPGADEGIVRTILAIDRDKQSMTFAGDIPQGAHARFMKANFDRLIDGAVGAAERSMVPFRESQPELALLISCVGRKIVLKQRIEEEVEGVRSVLGPGPRMTGFYSYGEISAFTPNAKCELHNQTMTITTISESNEEAA